MHKRIGLIIGLFLLTLALLTGCGGTASQGSSSSSSSSGQAASSSAKAGMDVTIQMLNVGQGDSVLIQTGEQTVLIDTSDVDERDKFSAELKKAGVTKIDKVILTHPHADHIGGMDVLLKNFQVGEVYDNGMPSTSKLYMLHEDAEIQGHQTRQTRRGGYARFRQRRQIHGAQSDESDGQRRSATGL